MAVPAQASASSAPNMSAHLLHEHEYLLLSLLLVAAAGFLLSTTLRLLAIILKADSLHEVELPVVALFVVRAEAAFMAPQPVGILAK